VKESIITALTNMTEHRTIDRTTFLSRGLLGSLGLFCHHRTFAGISAGDNDLFLPTDFAPFPWMEFALREYGIREISARGRTVNVEAYLRATGVGRSSDETPWCSAFVNWCMLMAGFPGTSQANARSWLKWGGVSLAFPIYGSVVVLWRNHVASSLGHVGFFIKLQEDHLLLLGGNQRDAVSIQAYPKERVLGMRWLQGFPIPEDIPE
jgi:uncharacterized protein (TIGR02594 family)